MIQTLAGLLWFIVSIAARNAGRQFWFRAYRSPVTSCIELTLRNSRNRRPYVSRISTTSDFQSSPDTGPYTEPDNILERRRFPDSVSFCCPSNLRVSFTLKRILLQWLSFESNSISHHSTRRIYERAGQRPNSTGILEKFELRFSLWKGTRKLLQNCFLSMKKKRREKGSIDFNWTVHSPRNSLIKESRLCRNRYHDEHKQRANRNIKSGARSTISRVPTLFRRIFSRCQQKIGTIFATLSITGYYCIFTTTKMIVPWKINVDTGKLDL